MRSSLTFGINYWNNIFGFSCFFKPHKRQKTGCKMTAQAVSDLWSLTRDFVPSAGLSIGQKPSDDPPKTPCCADAGDVISILYLHERNWNTRVALSSQGKLHSWPPHSLITHLHLNYCTCPTEFTSISLFSITPFLQTLKRWLTHFPFLDMVKL